MMRGKRKVELCKVGSGAKSTCHAHQSTKYSMPCPNCEGYRNPKKPVIREFRGWTQGDAGIMKPIYTEGERPKT